MGLGPADAVGVNLGQVDRLDRARRRDVRAVVEAPKSGSGASPDAGVTPPAPQAAAWAREEAAQRAQGSLWQSGRLQAWQSFHNGRGRQAAPARAVVIDARGARSAEPVAREVTPAPNGAEAEPYQVMNRAHHRAALFEERNREQIQPFLQGPTRPPKRRRGMVVK